MSKNLIIKLFPYRSLAISNIKETNNTTSCPWQWLHLKQVLWKEAPSADNMSMKWTVLSHALHFCWVPLKAIFFSCVPNTKLNRKDYNGIRERKEKKIVKRDFDYLVRKPYIGALFPSIISEIEKTNQELTQLWLSIAFNFFFLGKSKGRLKVQNEIKSMSGEGE